MPPDAGLPFPDREFLPFEPPPEVNANSLACGASDARDRDDRAALLRLDAPHWSYTTRQGGKPVFVYAGGVSGDFSPSRSA